MIKRVHLIYKDWVIVLKLKIKLFNEIKFLFWFTFDLNLNSSARRNHVTHGFVCTCVSPVHNSNGGYLWGRNVAFTNSCDSWCYRIRKNEIKYTACPKICRGNYFSWQYAGKIATFSLIYNKVKFLIDHEVDNDQFFFKKCIP